MRRKVPFLGEENISRADDESAQAKKSRGSIIDDVLSTQKQPTTWEDLVTSDYPDPVAPGPKVAQASVAMPSAPPPSPAPKPRPRTVPVTPGPILKKAVIESTFNSSVAAPSTSSSILSMNGSAIDWLPINSGHGLRINIFGSLDQNLRSEWRRLIEETKSSGVGQFEFNLMEAPNLTLTGLGMLLLFKEQKGSERGDIKLCHCNKDVWQMLQWTGMDKYFTIQGRPGNI